MYIDICIYIYIYVYIYIYIDRYICVNIYICLSVHICIYMMKTRRIKIGRRVGPGGSGASRIAPAVCFHLTQPEGRDALTHMC